MTTDDLCAQKSRHRNMRIIRPSQSASPSENMYMSVHFPTFHNVQFTTSPRQRNSSSAVNYSQRRLGSSSKPRPSSSSEPRNGRARIITGSYDYSNKPLAPPPSVPQPSPRSYTRARLPSNPPAAALDIPRYPRLATPSFSSFEQSSNKSPPNSFTSHAFVSATSYDSDLTAQSSPLLRSPLSQSNLSDSSSACYELDFPEPPPLPSPMRYHPPPCSMGIRRIRSSPLLLQNVVSPSLEVETLNTKVVTQRNRKAYSRDQQTQDSRLPFRHTDRKGGLFYLPDDTEALLDLSDEDTIQQFLHERAASNINDDDSISLMLQSLHTLGPRQSHALNNGHRPLAIAVGHTDEMDRRQYRRQQIQHTPATRRPILKPMVSLSDLDSHRSVQVEQSGGLPRIIRKMTSMRTSLRQQQQPQSEDIQRPKSRTMSRPSFALGRSNPPHSESLAATAPKAKVEAWKPSSARWSRDEFRGNRQTRSSREFRSYIDITPEKTGVHGKEKSRKNLWIRASQSLSIFGWRVGSKASE